MHCKKTATTKKNKPCSNYGVLNCDLLHDC